MPTVIWIYNILSLLREDIERGGTDGRPVALGTCYLDWVEIQAKAMWFYALKAPSIGGGTNVATFDMMKGKERPDKVGQP